jgi:uncharacterized protein (TIGR00369 family)
MQEESALFAIVDRFINSLTHCRSIGIKVVSARCNELVLELPYSDALVGDPDSGVFHGGAITTLMDTTCGSVVICALPDFELCPTLDLRVDYMHSAAPGMAVRAKASCFRETASILFVRCEAYQDETIIAHCVATFMRIGKEATPLEYRNAITGITGSAALTAKRTLS